jgi:hypothetical protein
VGKLRVIPGNSWTNHLKELCVSLAPPGTHRA